MNRVPTPTAPARVTAALVVAMLLVVDLSPVSSAVQGAGNGIYGRVFDNSRRPVGNLWVELLDEVNTVLARVRADSDGRFEFTRLSTGVFQVRVVTAGTIFAPQTARVELIQTMSAGGSAFAEHVDFYLKPAANAPPGTSPGTVFSQDVPETARKVFDEGVALLTEGKDPDAGIARLNDAVASFPTYFAALERLGIEYVRLGRYDAAVPVLSRALEVNPAGPESHYTLGVARYRLKKYPESAASLRKTLSLAPTSPNAPFAHYFLGLALLRDQKAVEAEPQLSRAYQLGGRSVPADVHMALAQIYSNDKRYKEAIAELELFLKEAPQAPDAEKVKAIIAQLRQKAR